MSAVSTKNLLSILAQQRGTALPLAMILLALLASLTSAFIAMSATEPLIAMNLRTGEEALFLAEAGIERARWALSNPAAPASGLTLPLPAPIPAAYNNQLVALGAGAYQLCVVTSVSASAGCVADPTLAWDEVRIVSTGSVLRNGAVLPGAPPIPQANLAAQRVVQVTVSAPCFGCMSPPGALTVGGSVQLAGNASITSTTSTCGAKNGVTYTDISAASGQADTVTRNGNAVINGQKSTTPPLTSTITNSQFQKTSLSPSDLAALKALAQASGTYIKPISSSYDLTNTDLSGTLRSGLTFVDTINGQAFGNSTPGQPYTNFNPQTDASKLATVSLAGNNNTGKGWLIIMGTLQMAGNSKYTGLAFAFNDYQGSGNSEIVGALISQNAVDTIATVVDSQDTGNAKVTYDCSAIATGGGTLSSAGTPTFTMKPGTWKSCPVGAC